MTALILGAVVFALLFAGFSALGVWQVQRLGWKQELIRQVDVRIHAAPVAAPPPDQTITRQADQYRQ